MQLVGKVDSLWRYPVKGMGGEPLESAYLGFAGVYGDRCCAIQSRAAPRFLPFLTAQEQHRLLLYRPRFRNSELMAQPLNLEDAQSIGPGLTPLYPDASELALEVTTPEGEVLSMDDPRLLEQIATGKHTVDQLKVLRSARALTDCRPVSIFPLQTGGQLSRELGAEVDLRRFRANMYVDLHAEDELTEEDLVGHQLRVGHRCVLAIVHRDFRCKVVGLDPETAALTPKLVRSLWAVYGGFAGVYGVVVEEGLVHRGDAIVLERVHAQPQQERELVLGSVAGY